MSDKSNNQGRAYEYIMITSLGEAIAKYRDVNITKNSSYEAAFEAWNTVDDKMKKMLAYSSVAAVNTIFELEPIIIESGNDALELMIQPDSRGEEGDVRDILIIRRGIQWEIGLSLKHNHFAVKHSRLAKNLDFGDKWYGDPCSNDYWAAVKPIFKYLTGEKEKKTLWKNIPDKENDVYVPLLQAFIDEVKRSYSRDMDLPRKMVEYLLGQYDFYKIISLDHEKTTQIQTYNLRGTLNMASSEKKPTISVPVTSLPTRLVVIEFKPGSKNKVELYFDCGWQFSFRIHNASTIVEPSLKFDIQIEGMPTTIISIDCKWDENE